MRLLSAIEAGLPDAKVGVLWCHDTAVDAPPRLDRAALGRALGAMPATAALVVLLPERTADADVLRPMIEAATAGSAVARGRAVTDAVKRVEHHRVAETLDRSRLFLIRLPAVVARDRLAALVAEEQGAVVDLAVGLAATVPLVLVDDAGRRLTV